MSKQSNTGLSAFVIEYQPPSRLIPIPSNARKHSQRQITKLKAVITEFGFTNPILIDEDFRIIAGHGRLEAAKALQLKAVPCIRLEHLSAAQKSALAIADNKLGDMSDFDPDLLAKQLAELCAVDFAVELTGFDTAEIDILLQTPELSQSADPADRFTVPDRDVPPVTRVGDIWNLGDHRLLCGNALEDVAYEQLLGDEQAEMIFTDSPGKVLINEHMSGLVRTGHAEFAMASGEMSPEKFTVFLKTYMGHAARCSTDGSIHYHCIDWSHLDEVLAAGRAVYSELKDLCVWNKTKGDTGSLYRSKHELILVYKNGTAPHVNNVNFERQGRYRTNVWDYAGVNTFGRTRDDSPAAHRTVKPVSLVADAIRDCSRRRALILDPFAGSGTIFLAAERTGRRAVGIELDPYYIDTAVRRWQNTAGRAATLTSTAQTFDEVARDRSPDGREQNVVDQGQSR